MTGTLILATFALLSAHTPVALQGESAPEDYVLREFAQHESAQNLQETSAPAKVRTVRAPSRDVAARAILDTAVTRMGGIAALRSVQRMRIESMTEWQRTSLDARPHAPVSSYEWSTELRDYVQPAWRYTRRFLLPTGWMEIVDLVVDSTAAMKNAGKWTPQNVAYVDERVETFTFSPERLMVLAYDAPDARALTDTVMTGTTYRRVRATVGEFHTTLLFGKRDGVLAAAQFRAAQPRDFGLAGWGAMEVEFRYSQWQRLRDVPINVPTQVNIYRVGKPYSASRLSVQHQTLCLPPIP